MIDEAGEYSKYLSPCNKTQAGYILKQFRHIEEQIKQIENDENAPWIRDRYYAELKVLYTPAISNSAKILRRCTVESVEENLDILMNYYRDVCLLTEEVIEELLDKELALYPRRKRYTKDYQKTIFTTLRTDTEEKRVGKKYEPKKPGSKDEYYCVHFTKNCSLEEVIWYLEHGLKKELQSNSKKKQTRTNTKSLKEKAFIGLLTSYGEKPSNIIKFLDKYFGEFGLVPYGDVKRIRNRLIKDDWFRKAYDEQMAIKQTNEFKKYYAEHKEYFKDIKKSTDMTSNDFAKITHYRYMKLSFNEHDSLFHVESALS